MKCAIRIRSAAVLVLLLSAIPLPAQSYAVKHSLDYSEGAAATANLTLSGSTLYGAAELGGVNGNGTVFSLKTNGSDCRLLHSFSAIAPQDLSGTNWDGSEPCGALVLSGDTLYGTARFGGTNGNGLVFCAKTNGADFVALHTFGPTYPDSNPAIDPFDPIYTNRDGANPQAGLVLSDERLYGTANEGGAYSRGTLFSMRADGTGFAVLHTFTAGPDGGSPTADLLLSGDTLYGTANTALENAGTVFSIRTNGADFTVLHAFHYSDGSEPRGGLLLAGDTLYGTTYSGGAFYCGTVYCLKTNGADFAVLKSFSGGTEGKLPYARLALVGNTLYGSADSGGNTNGWGVLFSVKTNGADFKVVHTFNGPDGSMPCAGLTASENVLYGITQFGGGGSGVIFSLTIPVPCIADFSLVGTNLLIAGTNGASQGTYRVLTSTNPAQPLNQWTPVMTNVFDGAGCFNLTATNAVLPGAPQQFYILQAQ